MAQDSEPLSPPADFGTIFRQELAEFGAASGIAPRGPTQSADDYARSVQNAAASGPVPLAALCLSGGGIRSAAFALGAMQGLARFGVLDQFHYLSTVSGGGYIGSWLTAWRHHASAVDTGPAGDEAVRLGLDQLRATGIEAPQIAALRADSNYLTPRYGILSVDTWAAAALVVRNLLMNWLIFLPLFLGVLLIPSVALGWIALVVKSGAGARGLYGLTGAVLALLAATNAVHGRVRRADGWIKTRRFTALVLGPAFLAAGCFTLAAAAGGMPNQLLWVGVASGIYALSWLFGRKLAGKTGEWRLLDFAAWTIAGTCLGGMLTLGFALVPDLHAASGQRLMAVLGVQWCLLSVFVGELVFVALTSFAARSDMDREWLARAGGVLAAAAATWTALAAVALYSPIVLPWIAGNVWTRLSALGFGGLSGIVTLVMSSSGRTPALAGASPPPNPLWRVSPSLAAVAFSVFLAANLAWLDSAVVMRLPGHFWLGDEPAAQTAVCGLILVAAAFLLSYFVNVNRFSLHALYRNRLVRTFLGAAREPERATRGADPFTGFAPADNVYLAALQSSRPDRLFHVINIALNIVGSKKLAWQERKAESFTVSRLACGNATVGYRPTAQYGGPKGLTLGTAMAISGAAVSPNMGYHSSPAIGFLLMLFNLRLGWWLGNPGKRAYGRGGPQPGLLPELDELAGNTTDTRNWVYLSDGGHFDDLGLYEMIKRRCRTIVAIDAGEDAHYTFQDLGNALRKIFIDQGVGVNFASFELQARQQPPVPGAYCAVGSIDYPDGAPPGWLLYVKPGYHGNERIDIRNYASDHADFPHETTLDQWFSESQFESYRALGAHIMEQICAGQAGRSVALGAACPIDDIAAFRQQVARYLACLAP